MFVMQEGLCYESVLSIANVCLDRIQAGCSKLHIIFAISPIGWSLRVKYWLVVELFVLEQNGTLRSIPGPEKNLSPLYFTSGIFEDSPLRSNVR